MTAVNENCIDVNWSAMHVHVPDEEHYYLWTCTRNIPFYNVAKRKVEATFGPSILVVWHDGMKEARRCLEFHPLEYQKILRFCVPQE